jgi:hypothetical protein
MSAAIGLMGVLPDASPSSEWEALVREARALASRLRAPPADDDAGGDAFLVSALETVAARASEDEEFVAALGAARGHDALFRLVSHEREAVAALAADAVCACADNVPPGGAFPDRGGLGSGAPDVTAVAVGRLARPLRFSLRHVREPNLGGEKKSIPNIAWHSGVVLARWLAGYAERRASDPARSRPDAAKRVFAPDEDDDDDDAIDALEIGAGLGAPSFAAAAYALASRVAVTDVDPTAVRNAAYNAACGARCSDGARASKPTDASSDASDADASSAAFARAARSRVAARCVATTLDWNDPEPILAGVRARLARDPRWRGASSETRRRTSTSRDGDFAASRDDFSDDASASASSSPPRRFRLVLGADVVHEDGMARGVARAVGECLDLARGVALICNPAPEHRAGAAELPDALEANGLEWVRRRVASPMLRVGMEEETEDVALDVFAIRARGAAVELPDVEDVGEAWVRYVG